VSLHVITMAFVVVLCTCGLLIPIMLYVFQVSPAPTLRTSAGQIRQHLYRISAGQAAPRLALSFRC